MPQLREIVDEINIALKGGNFATRKFQDGKWYNIAEFLTREEKDEKITKFPAIIDEFGECIDVNPNDTYPIQFYHRILGILPTDVQLDDFGNNGNQITEVDEMVLVIVGDRKKTLAYRENVASAVWAQFPRELTIPNLQSCLIEPLEINNDRESVWYSEFENVEFALEPQQYMIALKYRITAIYSKNCFTLCN